MFVSLPILVLMAALPADEWAIRSARMAGAAASVHESVLAFRQATAVATTEQRLAGLGWMHSEALALHRRVLSAGLALHELDQPEISN